MTALLLLSLALPFAAAETPQRLFEAGKYQQVIAEFSGEKLHHLRQSEQRKGYLYLGMSHERLSQPEQALGIYQLGVKLFPKDINLLSQLAFLLQRMGLEERAEPLFRKVLMIHPNNALSHRGLAEIDHALGFLDRGAGHYERALETMADKSDVWHGYGELLLSLRDPKTAEMALRRSLALSPQAETLFDLARAQRADDRLDEALQTLREALDKFPGRVDIALARALWLLEADRAAEALSAAEAAIKAGAGEPLAYWIRARANLKHDRYSAAVADLTRAAAAERAAPFTAKAAKALLKQLGAAP